jgi:hypothetical protein
LETSLHQFYDWQQHHFKDICCRRITRLPRMSRKGQ